MAQEVGNTARNAAGQTAGSKRLTEQQQAFVAAYVGNGGKQTVAAKTAGYAFPRVEGYHLLTLPRIVAAVKKHHDQALCGNLASLALDVVKEILNDPRKDKDFMQIKARVALKVIERAGIGADQDAVESAGKAFGSMSIAELEAFVGSYREREAKTLDITPVVGSPGDAKPL